VVPDLVVASGPAELVRVAASGPEVTVRAVGAAFDVPAALDFSSADLPVFPAVQLRVFHVPTAAESVRGLPCHAAGNGNSGCAACSAVPLGGTCRLNTGAGRRAAGRVTELNLDSTGPIRLYAVPIHGPSADPSGAAHWTAIRENTPEAAGSSSRGPAG
jgi:hypothetical protein